MPVLPARRTAPDFVIDNRRGQVGEEYLEAILVDGRDRVVGFEVKTDYLAAATGNAYIEFEQRPHGRAYWVASGIATTEAEVFGVVVVGDDGQPVASLLMDVARVRAALPALIRLGRVREGGSSGDNPSRGVVVGFAALVAVLAETPV